MKKSELKFIADWERRRSKGCLKYCLIEGSIFGLITMILVELLTYFLDANYAFTWSKLALIFAVWILGGIVIYGPLMWMINTYYYKKFMKKYALQIAEKSN